LSSDGELPLLAKAGLLLGVVAVIAVAINIQSGGDLFLLAKHYVSGEADSISNQQAEIDPVDEAETSDEQIDDAMRSPWDCYYDATMNDNWHDDVVCRNGVDWKRPTLLKYVDFVTEADMVAAGEAYEHKLNSRQGKQ